MATQVPPAVARRAPGITYRQLDYWTRKGYLKAGSPGSGYERTWSRAELDVAGRMVRLTAVGLAPAAAADLARRGPGRHELAPGIHIDVEDRS